MTLRFLKTMCGRLILLRLGGTVLELPGCSASHGSDVVFPCLFLQRRTPASKGCQLGNLG